MQTKIGFIEFSQGLTENELDQIGRMILKKTTSLDRQPGNRVIVNGNDYEFGPSQIDTDTGVRLHLVRQTNLEKPKIVKVN